MRHMDNERSEKGMKDKETGPGESKGKVKVNLLPFLLSLKGKPAKKGKSK